MSTHEALRQAKELLVHVALTYGVLSPETNAAKDLVRRCRREARRG